MSVAGATFTCNSCLIQFRASDIQRYHMKTEWHRYNLKRRVAGLPPIDAAQFAKKLQISERERAENQVDDFGFPILQTHHRLPKNKRHFKQDNKIDLALRNRSSDKNKDTLPPARSPSPTGSIVSSISKLSVLSGDATTDFGEDTLSEYGFTSESNYEPDSGDDASSLSSVGQYGNGEISLKDCIFCGAKHKELEKNICHMFQEHGLYIPERSYLIDHPGLMKYLIEIVICKKSCLCCSFKGTSLESIRAHMNSKRHCRLPYETKEERQSISQFYDFTSLESQSEKLDISKPKKIHFVNGDAEEAETSEDLNGPGNDVNSNYSVVPIDSTGMELTLPNGARAGHRIGQRYYRQNLTLPPEHEDSRRTVSAADRRLASGITERQFKQGLKNMQQLEKRALNQQIRKEKSSKINYQAHYRDELLQ